MIDAKQLRDYVIIPVLSDLGLFSESAIKLMLGTAATESCMGTYIKQLSGGPALGIYQIEPKTYEDLFTNYFYGVFANAVEYKDIPNCSEDVERKKRFIKVLTSYTPNKFLKFKYDRDLIANLNYSTAIARLIYYRVPEELPDANDLNGLAKYYKKYYNSRLGKGSVVSFISNYEKYVINK